MPRLTSQERMVREGDNYKTPPVQLFISRLEDALDRGHHLLAPGRLSNGDTHRLWKCGTACCTPVDASHGNGGRPPCLTTEKVPPLTHTPYRTCV